jgi:hypothetical protein
MLAGPQVIEDTAQAYDAGNDLPSRSDFSRRWRPAKPRAATARQAGRGPAVLFRRGIPALDLRVDDNPEPLTELLRLYVKSLERYQPFVACLPSRARPAGVTDRSQIEAEIERFHAATTARGPHGVPPRG